MKNLRKLHPRLRRTRLAVMAAVVTIAVRGLSSATCHNPSVKSPSFPGASVGPIVKHDRTHDRYRIARAQGGGFLAKGSKAVTNASVMWGSFAPRGTRGEGGCELPAPPAFGAAPPCVIE